MSTLRKPLLILCFTAAVIFLAVFIITNRIHTPQSAVDQFLSAVDDENYSSLKSMISCKEVSITEDNLIPFVTLYHEDDSFRESVQDLLNQDINSYQNHKTPSKDKLINVVSTNHLFYHTYRIYLSAYSIDITANLYPTTVTINDEEDSIDLLDGSAFTTDLMLPGIYTFNSSYINPITEEELTCSNDIALVNSDQTAAIDFKYATLNFTTPSDYVIDSIQIGGNSYPIPDAELDGSYTITPVDCDTSIMVTCTTSWGTQVSTSFAIPEEFVNQTYQYACDFSSTSMDFKYEEGLAVQTIHVNGTAIKNLSDYVDTTDCHFTLSDLTLGTTIDCTFLTPWDETLSYSITLDDSTINDFNQTIDLPLADETTLSLVDYAGQYYLGLIDAVNETDYDTLEQLSSTDELATDFYSMLTNIRYDYEDYADTVENFDESILFEPVSITVDKSSLINYSYIFEARIHGIIRSTVTSMDFETLEPVVETSNTNYDETLYLYYDTSKESWVVTEGYYDYTGTVLSDPVAIK